MRDEVFQDHISPSGSSSPVTLTHFIKGLEKSENVQTQTVSCGVMGVCSSGAMRLRGKSGQGVNQGVCTLSTAAWSKMKNKVKRIKPARRRKENIPQNSTGMCRTCSDCLLGR